MHRGVELLLTKRAEDYQQSLRNFVGVMESDNLEGTAEKEPQAVFMTGCHGEGMAVCCQILLREEKWWLNALRRWP